MTTTESRFSDSGRSGTGLAITIALHAGVAALALAGLGVIKTNRTVLKPIIVDHIPDPVTAPPLPAPPPTTDLPVSIDVPQPVLDPTVYPDTSGEPPVITGPTSAEPGMTGPATVSDPPPEGPTSTARWDKRHAADAQPPYPPAARRLGEEGTVVVHVCIGRDGRVLAASLAQSSGSPRLDAAAVAHALARWRFIPALKGGEAVEEERDISVRFQLSQGR